MVGESKVWGESRIGIRKKKTKKTGEENKEKAGKITLLRIFELFALTYICKS